MPTSLCSDEMKVLVNGGNLSVSVQTAEGKSVVTFQREAGQRSGSGGWAIERDPNEKLYGIHGLDIQDDDAGILRTSGGVVAAGVQGNAGGRPP